MVETRLLTPSGKYEHSRNEYIFFGVFIMGVYHLHNWYTPSAHPLYNINYKLLGGGETILFFSFILKQKVVQVAKRNNPRLRKKTTEKYLLYCEIENTKYGLLGDTLASSNVFSFTYNGRAMPYTVPVLCRTLSLCCCSWPGTSRRILRFRWSVPKKTITKLKIQVKHCNLRTVISANNNNRIWTELLLLALVWLLFHPPHLHKWKGKYNFVFGKFNGNQMSDPWWESHIWDPVYNPVYIFECICSGGIAIVTRQVKVGQCHLLVKVNIWQWFAHWQELTLKSSLCVVLVDRELNELCCIPFGKSTLTLTRGAFWRRRQNLTQTGGNWWLCQQICVQHFCHALDLLNFYCLLTFFKGKVPFINTEWWREDDCFQAIMSNMQNFPFTNEQDTFHFTSHY